MRASLTTNWAWAWACACACACACVASAGCASFKFVPDPSGGFESRDTAGHRHYVYRPAGFAARERWPVIVFLHGGGERGSDGTAPTQTPFGKLLFDRQGAFPFVAVLPQCEAGVFWSDPRMQRRVLEALDDVIVHDRGDPQRVILSGHSMGGYGSWLLGWRHVERFAALAPMSGAIMPPPTAPRPPGSPPVAADAEGEAIAALKQTPIWAFQGEADLLVPADMVRRLIDRATFAGGNIRYTEYRGVGHGSDELAWQDPEFITWLLAQQRTAP